jgi:hypothetical protein
VTRGRTFHKFRFSRDVLAAMSPVGPKAALENLGPWKRPRLDSMQCGIDVHVFRQAFKGMTASIFKA